MFVRSTTAGDVHCVNADVEAHTRHLTGLPAGTGGAQDAERPVLWLAVDGGRPLVVANTDRGGMAGERLGGPFHESDLHDDDRRTLCRESGTPNALTT